MAKQLQIKIQSLGYRKKNVYNFFSFLYNTSSTVSRVWSPVIDFSLHLLLAHWPGRRLQAPENAHSYFKDSFYCVFTARLCKNISMRPLTGGLQKSKEAQLASELQSQVLLSHNIPLLNSLSGLEKKRLLLNVYTEMSVSHWTSLVFRCQTAFNFCAKANATMM